MDSIRTPGGLHQESMDFVRSISGLHQEFTWSIRTPDGVHQDAWGSVTYRLDGKTPYEMKHKKNPHLGGIHEFGAAAYVKDLKAKKLDARAQLGRFVGYDSESKGYRIYWPTK